MKTSESNNQIKGSVLTSLSRSQRNLTTIGHSLFSNLTIKVLNWISYHSSGLSADWSEQTKQIHVRLREWKSDYYYFLCLWSSQVSSVPTAPLCLLQIKWFMSERKIVQFCLYKPVMCWCVQRARSESRFCRRSQPCRYGKYKLSFVNADVSSAPCSGEGKSDYMTP